MKSFLHLVFVLGTMLSLATLHLSAQVNVESWPKASVSTPIGIPCGPSNAPEGQHDWTSLYPVADGHENKVFVQFTMNRFRYDNGQYQIAYRFVNRYPEIVDFDVEFETLTDGRRTRTTESYQNLTPGAQTSTSGRWTICQTMISARMKFLRVGHLQGMIEHSSNSNTPPANHDRGQCPGSLDCFHYAFINAQATIKSPHYKQVKVISGIFAFCGLETSAGAIGAEAAGQIRADLRSQFGNNFDLTSIFVPIENTRDRAELKRANEIRNAGGYVESRFTYVIASGKCHI